MNLKLIILSVLLGLFIVSNPVQAQTYNMSNGNISTCSGTFYDPGGTSDYSISQDFTMTFCSSTAGQEISFNFTTFNTESGWDEITIYQGVGTGGTLVGEYDGTELLGQTVSSAGSGCLTFVWHSDGSVVRAGWTATISCVFGCQQFSTNNTFNGGPFPATVNICTGTTINLTASGVYPNNDISYHQDDASSTFVWTSGTGQTVNNSNASFTYGTQGVYPLALTVTDINGCTYTYTKNINVTCGGACPPCTDITVDDPDINTCMGTFYDTGMNGDYTNSENQTITICPDAPGQAVNVNFTQFNTESCCDHLYIHNGNSTAAAMITGLGGSADNDYDGTELVGQTATSTSGDGCLTFVWTSDGSVLGAGWLGSIFCSTGCQAFNVNSTANGTPIAGNIATCIGSAVNFTTTPDFINNDINYHQDVATTTFDWDFGNGTTSNLQNPSVTYNTQGTYTVTLTITDINNCPIVTTYTVDVSCGGACPVCTDIFPTDPDVNTCVGTFWDTGGATGNYSNNENQTITICSDNGGFPMIHFLSFNTESIDKLKIYDGPSTASPLIGIYFGTVIPPDITASGTCLTYTFTSDGSVVGAGWSAELSCQHPCQAFDLGITTNPAMSADSLIHTCPGTPVAVTTNLTFPNNDVNYHQDLASTTINWSTANGLNGTGSTFTLPSDSAFSTVIYVDAEDVNGCHVYDTLYVVSECIPIDVSIAHDAVINQNGEVFLPSTATPIALDGSHVFNTAGACYTQTLGQYTWTYGFTDGSGDLYESHAQDSTIVFPANGIYEVVLEVSDQMGCSSSTSIEVHVGCQPIDVTWTGTPYQSGDTIMVCPGQAFDLTIAMDYFANDQLYHQDDATNTYNWNMGDGTLFNNTYDFGSYTFANDGMYNILLSIFDANGCPDQTHIPILAFMEPSLAGTTFSNDTICLGDSIILFGHTSVEMPSYSAPPVFLPDGGGVSYTSTLTFDIFGDAILTDVNDFESICINMEHSFMGDLRLRLYCPNGQFTELIPYPNGGGGNYIGEPVDDESNTIGDGYQYCFTPQATSTWIDVMSTTTYTYTDNAGIVHNNVNYIPAGDYAPTGTFDDLVGCPLNGDWQIQVTDNIGIDNGMIFDWSITLNQDGLLPPDTIQLPMDMRVWTVATGGAATINSFYEDDAYATPLDTGLYTFTFTCTSPAGCVYDTTIGPLYVAPLPVVTIGNDTNLCAAYTYTIPGTLAGGTGTWTASGPGNTVFSNVNTIPTTVTVDAFGDYTFTFTPHTLAQCNTIYDIDVLFHELPTVLEVIDSVSCFGYTDGQITLTPLGIEVPYNYVWSNGANLAANTNLAAGLYQVTVNSMFCQNTFSYVVEEPTKVEIIDSSKVDNLCFGQQLGSVSVIVQGGTLGYTYNWSPAMYSANASTIGSLPDGHYSVTVTDHNGCTAVASKSVNGPLNPLTIDQIIPTDVSCFGASDGQLNVQVSGGTTPYVYHWMLADGTISSSEDLTGLIPGNYFVTVTDANLCSTNGSRSITQMPELIVNGFATPVTCFGDTDGEVWVTTSSGMPPYNYVWNTGWTDSVIVLAPSDFYHVTITDSRGCSKTISNLEVTQPLPVVFAIIPSPPICIGESANLGLSVTSSPFSPFTYYWNGLLSTDAITVNPVVTTIYSAQVIDAHGCESNVQEVTVQVHGGLSATAHLDTASVCKGQPVQVELDVTGGNGQYEISFENGQALSNQFTVYPSQSMDYRVIIEDNCSTPADTVEFHIDVWESYLPSFHADYKNGCLPLEVNFIQDVQGHEQGTQYRWTFGEEDNMAFDAQAEHTFRFAGTFDVSLEIITAHGCKSIATEQEYINVFPIPEARFAARPATKSIIDPVIYFDNLSTGGYTWHWIFGDGDSTFAFHTMHEYAKYPQDYNVTLVVTSEHMCADTAHSFVRIVDEVAFYLPTRFTPDNDNLNETFRPYGNGLSSEGYRLTIYDRWGSPIFETNELEKGWDGRVNGHLMAPNGVYTYVVKFTDTDKVPHEKSGTVNLTR